MTHKILNAPINTYFDVTPSGWILNWFSNDVEKLDRDMADNLFDCLDELNSFFIIVYVIVMNTAWLLLLIPIVSFFVTWHVKVNIWTYWDLVWMHSLTKSPVITHFGESLAGVSTIRAFKK